MKPRTILIFSLIGNLSLGATAYHFWNANSAAKSSEEEKAEGRIKHQPNQSRENAQSNEATIKTNVVEAEFFWRQIEAPDYKVYIENLRAVGCPEETIRDIIVADVNKLFRTKREAITGDEIDQYQYWKTGNSWGTKESEERQKQLQALEKEKSALLVELLGVDPNKERNKELGIVDYWDQRMNFLPEEKQSHFKEIREKFQEQRQEIYRDGIFDAEDGRKLRQIDKDEISQMTSFLTPDEIEQYRLRFSQTADQLRSDLEVFEPSEEEFKTIYRLREARADELILSNDQDDKETRETRKKATEEINAQVKAAFGDARYAEYERAQDWSYRELARLTDRLELPKGSAAAVYDMKKAAEEQVRQIRSNKDLAQEQKNQALQAVREATEKEAQTTLGGEKNFNRYKSGGGWWLNNLAPSIRPKPKVTVTP